ncbi:MAG: DNA-binding protein, partial [Candidatus Heimdallarchaeota archaeon]
NQDDAVRKQQERVIRATMIVNQFLEIDAREYMEWLSRAKPAVAQTIKDTIILLAQKKMIPKPLSKIDIRKIERELTGEQSQIKVKRRGKEATDLNEVMKGKQ